MTRGVVLTGLVGSLIFFALALFILNPLREKDLEQARGVEGQLRQRMTAPLSTPNGEGSLRDGKAPVGGARPSGGALPVGADPLEIALANQAAVLEVDSSTLYESVEARAFEIAQLERQLPGTGSAARLSPPQRLRPIYVRGAVDIAWAPGLPNIELNKALRAGKTDDLRLAYRVYRGNRGATPQLLATLEFGTESLRDTDVLLAAGSFSYEVWAVLLRGSGDDEVLVAAERSDRVTVTTPEHFTIVLLSGSAESASFLITATAGDRAGTVTRLSVAPNDELVVEEPTGEKEKTGLTLTSLVVADDPRLEQRERLALTSDGSLILEPGTRRPQTMQTPVLMNVTRLQATLVNEAGEPRILEVDLP